MKAFPVSKPSSYTDEPYFETCTHPIAFCSGSNLIIYAYVVGRCWRTHIVIGYLNPLRPPAFKHTSCITAVTSSMWTQLAPSLQSGFLSRLLNYSPGFALDSSNSQFINEWLPLPRTAVLPGMNGKMITRVPTAFVNRILCVCLCVFSKPSTRCLCSFAGTRVLMNLFVCEWVVNYETLRDQLPLMNQWVNYLSCLRLPWLMCHSKVGV